jgi:hypothetical protein|tara:strand:- start:22115 stop:22306 length:192 start_codon:yes stop_codon:yes gene_type:complete
VFCDWHVTGLTGKDKILSVCFHNATPCCRVIAEAGKFKMSLGMLQAGLLIVPNRPTPEFSFYS